MFTCPKCGDTDILVSFIPEGSPTMPEYVRRKWWEDGPFLIGDMYDRFRASKDHLFCACNCQYFWRQNTLDDKGE